MAAINVNNPIIPLDYPDPDIIRVGDTYYMVSTTMYYFPGCEILKSYDLVHWEHASFVYKTLDGTDGQRLENGKNIYGQGMWAASLRYHKGIFYIIFAANDTHRTYLYTSRNIFGPWEKSLIDGFYHDASLLFDDDERVFIVYGNTDIYLTELKSDLSGPKPGGLDRCIISEKDNPNLGYEGAHVYKINGFYYVFLIHSLPEKWMRAQACFMSDDLNNEFTGRDILIDDRGFPDQGVAQGGIIDTPEGDWYSILFQDMGAVGRLPVLVPVRWENDFPVIGPDKKIPEKFSVTDQREGHQYKPLVDSDDFKKNYDTPYGLKPCWQFNHEPLETGYSLNTEEGHFELTNTSLSRSVTEARNTLTQRMLYPSSSVEVTVDGASLNDGDVAGLCALHGAYAFIALTKENGKWYIVMRGRKAKKVGSQYEKEHEYERVEVDSKTVTFRMETDFSAGKDTCRVYYKTSDQYLPLGTEHPLTFKLDFFTGCRYGLFSYATRQTGGTATYSRFIYCG